LADDNKKKKPDFSKYVDETFSASIKDLKKKNPKQDKTN
jgi:hypothetical protein